MLSARIGSSTTIVARYDAHRMTMRAMCMPYSPYSDLILSMLQSHSSYDSMLTVPTISPSLMLAAISQCSRKLSCSRCPYRHRTDAGTGTGTQAHRILHLLTLDLPAGMMQAPRCVGEALKGGRLVAAVMQRAGFAVTPLDTVVTRPSFITAVQLGSPEAMQAFCSAVQAQSPVGSYIRPVPGASKRGRARCP